MPANSDFGLFGDVPRWIWRLFLSGWAMLFGLFVLFLATDAHAAFAIAIACFFALVAFGLPLSLAGQSRCADHECDGIIQTRTGPLSVGAAAVQIALIPIAAAGGLLAFIILAL